MYQGFLSLQTYHILSTSHLFVLWLWIRILQSYVPTCFEPRKLWSRFMNWLRIQWHMPNSIDQVLLQWDHLMTGSFSVKQFYHCLMEFFGGSGWLEITWCFNFLVSNNKLACTSKCSLFQCQASRYGCHWDLQVIKLLLHLFWSLVMSRALLLFFSLMVLVTLLFLSMCIWNIYNIILLLQNLMYFLLSILFKFLLRVNFYEKLNVLQIIGVVNNASETLSFKLSVVIIV
jgi:hypothetical protein